MMFSRGSLTLFVCVCWCLSSVTWAQPAAGDRIPGDITASATVLNATQRQVVSTFATRWVAQLKTEDDLSVVEARDRLMEPLRGQPSANFKTAYAAAVSPLLMEPLGSSRVMNRLNTMIVASVMVDKGLLPVVIKGLKDESPAVRYWAGRSAGNLGAAVILSHGEEGSLVKQLTDNIVKEDNRLVLQSLLLGLSNLNIPDASTQLLASLNARVGAHVANPALTAMPEARALETMFSRIARTLGGNQPDAQTRDILRQALAVMYRYVRTTATVMVKNPPQGSDLLREYQSVLEIGDIWLPWAYERLTGQTQLPGYSQPMKTAQWSTVLLTIQDDMFKTLTSPPLSLNADDLKVE